MKKEQIENNFMYHAPKEGQQEKYEELRKKAKELVCLMVAFCPNSRERSLAITKIEEGTMWANASIAREKEAEPVEENKCQHPRVSNNVNDFSRTCDDCGCVVGELEG